MQPKTPRLESSTPSPSPPPPPTTTTTTAAPLSPTTTTTTTTPSINQIQRQDWDTNNHNKLMKKVCTTTTLVPISEFKVEKISRKKKAEISNFMDPPGINNT